jgi:hypothetical protein
MGRPQRAAAQRYTPTPRDRLRPGPIDLQAARRAAPDRAPVRRGPRGRCSWLPRASPPSCAEHPAHRGFQKRHYRASKTGRRRGGALPRTLAYQLYTRTGPTGEDARTAYGAHKEPGHARATVIGGLAAMTGDTITPVSMFPVVHATWDDPDHPGFQARQEICDGAAALKPFGLQPNGSIAAFAEHQFALLQHARAMLTDAARRGSRVCAKYEIDPQHLLDWAMPNRVVSGPFRLGASASNGMINNVVLLPGLDADLLRTADEHDIELLAYAFDHMTETMAPLLSQLEKLAIVSQDDFFHGPELTDLLTGDQRWELPELSEISSRALDVIGTNDRAGHSGAKIDGAATRYFRVPSARLKAGDQGRRPPLCQARVRRSAGRFYCV